MLLQPKLCERTDLTAFPQAQCLRIVMACLKLQVQDLRESCKALTAQLGALQHQLSQSEVLQAGLRNELRTKDRQVS